MPEGADRDTVPVAPDTASSPEEAGRRGILENPEKTVSVYLPENQRTRQNQRKRFGMYIGKPNKKC